VTAPAPAGGSSRLDKVSTLMLARVVYAFNWYNVGAVLPLIGTHLDATTPELGIVVSSFLIGAAVFQLVAGFAVLRWGARNVAILALFLMGAFTTASAFSPNWIVLSVLRFGAGAGAAFFFAPALSLVTSMYPTGSQGPIIGVYNAGFSIGSGIGLLGGAFIGVVFGWPYALLLGGIALLACGVVAVGVLRPAPPRPTHRPIPELWRAALPILRSRALWTLAIATAGLWAAYVLAAQYFVQYSVTVHPSWSIAIAAGIPTVMILFEIPGGPIGGLLGERARDMRRVLFVWGALAGAMFFLIPFLGYLELFGLFAFLGFADGVLFAILYLLPIRFPETRGEHLTLGLAMLNAIQIFLGSALALGFAFIADAYGYTVAWAFTGVIALLPLPLLIGFGRRHVGLAAPAIPTPVTGAAVPRPVRPE